MEQLCTTAADAKAFMIHHLRSYKYIYIDSERQGICNRVAIGYLLLEREREREGISIVEVILKICRRYYAYRYQVRS